MANTNILSRVKGIVLEKKYEISKYDDALLKLYQDYLFYKKNNQTFNIDTEKDSFIKYVTGIKQEDRLKSIAFDKNNYIWGMMPRRETSEKILDATSRNEDIIFVEDSFLRCIVGTAQILPENMKHYHNSYGYILDDLTAYFDATRPSRMEKIINSDFVVSPEQIERSRNVIKKIIDNKISKYNNQPIYKPEIGRKNAKKILVIDQSYKDFSISKGCADDRTFEKMLNTAVKENPDADIIIKTHPDTIGENSTKVKCYYQNIQSEGNIYRLTDAINPISLIEYADKIYVCSSQFGFEALMCNKEVHTFGMPFYAGWGLTVDDQTCERRTRNRTLEEIFYISYIHMPQYLDVETNSPCEIEHVIDRLIKNREQYFKEIKNRIETNKHDMVN